MLTDGGQWITPVAIGIIDDRSRLVCHIQWYPIEKSEDLIHAYRQACQTRGLPRQVMTDCGSAMTCLEFQEGNARLCVILDTTIPYTPEQIGKIERFWGTLEAQLRSMLENRSSLTINELNDATQAWIELGYNRSHHDELGSSPYDCFAKDDNDHRPCPKTTIAKIGVPIPDAIN